MNSTIARQTGALTTYAIVILIFLIAGDDDGANTVSQPDLSVNQFLRSHGPRALFITPTTTRVCCARSDVLILYFVHLGAATIKQNACIGAAAARRSS